MSALILTLTVTLKTKRGILTSSVEQALQHSHIARSSPTIGWSQSTCYTEGILYSMTL